MKRLYLLLCLLGVSVSLVHADAKRAALRHEFIYGLEAGVLAGFVLDGLRAFILPDMTSRNLYGNYGICRDQLHGGVKVAAAVAALYWYTQDNDDAAGQLTDTELLITRLTGILAGINSAAYITKKLS